ncbi:MGMT family protein [Brachyspira hyodysenteriae]|nr:MGMT family protein [Brachyspira hyodysenteriae]MCZ9982557.1 MGMT family protein [Brachyspira hyodysenteriae]MDA0081911.1 MGMT family protein [Brachyspira hyodysenteriae]
MFGLKLQKIPFGKVVTYSDIARNISDKKGSISRAVGTAEGKNKIAIIIPCHRVVGVNKKLTGYAGGLDKKEYLLKLEGFNIVNSKIIIE